MNLLILDATDKTVTGVLGEAVSSTQPTIVTSYADSTSSDVTEGSSDTAFNSTTDITIISAPASSTRRLVKEIAIYNGDAIDHTYIVKYDNNGTERVVFTGTITAGSMAYLSSLSIYNPEHQEYLMPIWAEQSGVMVTGVEEWSFGNGAEVAGNGVTVYVPTGWTATAVAMSLKITSGTGSVDLVKNGVSLTTTARVTIATGRSVVTELTTPIAIANGDSLDFITSADSGTGAGNTVCVFLRFVKD